MIIMISLVNTSITSRNYPFPPMWWELLKLLQTQCIQWKISFSLACQKKNKTKSWGSLKQQWQQTGIEICLFSNTWILWIFWEDFLFSLAEWRRGRSWKAQINFSSSQDGVQDWLHVLDSNCILYPKFSFPLISLFFSCYVVCVCKYSQKHFWMGQVIKKET